MQELHRNQQRQFAIVLAFLIQTSCCVFADCEMLDVCVCWFNGYVTLTNIIGYYPSNFSIICYVIYFITIIIITLTIVITIVITTMIFTKLFYKTILLKLFIKSFSYNYNCNYNYNHTYNYSITE
jgi:hypothetical protein